MELKLETEPAAPRPLLHIRRARKTREEWRQALHQVLHAVVQEYEDAVPADAMAEDVEAEALTLRRKAPEEDELTATRHQGNNNAILLRRDADGGNIVPIIISGNNRCMHM